MSSVGPAVGAGSSTPAEVRAAARDSVREVVAAGGASGRPGRRWMVPMVAASAVAAAACTPVAWPLLAGGALAGPAALTMAFGQVGAVGGGLLSEVVIRAWDRLQAGKGANVGQGELREALTAELRDALIASTERAAGLRAEVAGVLQGVDAVKVALTTTIETSARESADQVRAVLVRGLRDLGLQFAEFGWLLEEVNDQITVIAEVQTEIAAGSRAMLEAQQRTLMQLALLRQQTRPLDIEGVSPASVPEIAGMSPDAVRVAALVAAGIQASPECPYPGLAAFRPQDVGRFFGRERAVAALVTRLAEQLTRPGLLMVLGPSGSGKSSLIRAGLVPAIAAGELPARGSGEWPVDLMTPGRRPLLELATRVAAVAGIPAGALDADLRTDPIRIIPAIRQALLTHASRQALSSGTSLESAPAVIDPEPAEVDAAGNAARSADASRARAIAPPRLVLIVDQFEEVFTQCTDIQERQAFVQALSAAAGTASTDRLPVDGTSRGMLSSRDAPALVVIGIRADFYARAAACSELVTYLQDCQVLVGPMDQAGLRAAIENPAASAGLVVDAGLVEVLLADLGLHSNLPLPESGDQADQGVTSARTSQQEPTDNSYEAGRLPLLAYALQQTWRHREGRRLTVAAYRATGGIDGAIAHAAESVYERLDSDQRQSARRMLLRMVSPGEGTADTRRRVTVTELAGTADQPSRRGLVDVSPHASARAVLTELIQARLLTADTGTDGTETVEISHEALLSAWPRLREWLTQDRAGQRIHRDLTDATRAWQAQRREPSHLFGGTRLAVARDWAASHKSDLNNDERAFLSACQERERNAGRRRRVAIGALAMLTLVSAVTAGLAVHDNGEAVRARDQAINNQVGAEIGQLQAIDPSLAAQLELVDRHLDPNPKDTSLLLSSANNPLSNPLTGATGPVNAVAFSPNGHILAAGSDDDTIRLWRITEGFAATQIGQPLNGFTGPVWSVAFSPNGQILAASSRDGTIWLWNVTNPAHPEPIGQPLTESTSPTYPFYSVAFSPDGHTLAAGDYDGTVWLWNVTDPASPTYLRHVGQSRTGRIGVLNSVGSVAFSPDGRTLAAGSYDDMTRLWNVTDPARPTAIGEPLTGPTDSVNTVAFSPNGHTLAIGSRDTTIRLWDVTDPAHPTPIGQPLTEPNAPVWTITFSPDGQTLAAGSYDGTIWLWNVTDLAHPAPIGQPLTGPTGRVYSVAFSPDGHTLAAGSADDTIRLWSLSSTVLADPNGGVTSVGFSPDGHILAAGNGDNTIRLWNVTNPAHPAPIGQPLTGPTAAVESVAFSPDGHILAAGSYDGTIRLWNVTNPAHPTQIGQPLIGPGTAPVFSVTFSPDGNTLATGIEDATIRLWNVTNPAHPTQIGQPLTGPVNPVESVAFSPDGHTLAAGIYDGTICLWNAIDPAFVVMPNGQCVASSNVPVYSVAFSPDRHTLAASGNDDTIQLWNVTNPTDPTTIGQPLTGPSGPVASVTFSPDGHTLVAGIHDGTIWLWNVTNPAHTTQIGSFTGHTGAVPSVMFSPNGHTLASGSLDGTIRLWNLNVDQAISRICTTTSTNLTPQQWARYIPQLPYDPPCDHL